MRLIKSADRLEAWLDDNARRRNEILKQVRADLMSKITAAVT